MLCMLLFICYFFFFKQKTAYEMRISDWSSDVCSSDLAVGRLLQGLVRAVDAFVQAGHRLDELGAALADGFRRGGNRRGIGIDLLHGGADGFHRRADGGGTVLDAFRALRADRKSTRLNSSH